VRVAWTITVSVPLVVHARAVVGAIPLMFFSYVALLDIIPVFIILRATCAFT